ncbi:recombination regulator RecX [Rhizobium sp. DKSPLA3]|uniref:Regulatory protein RecX n=1 Tax=Rhizobium quercicola TaxID=2901226 RepID=A0A9X1SZF8_9HYPH|nr:recombination regulator RecX [Rhizobium quercicola]MCD7107964.1 recombination regulator RecX [Rhizobium quercicola]
MDEGGQDDEAVPSPVPTPRMLSWARNSAAYRLGKRMHTEKQLSDAIARKAREKFEGISDEQVTALSAFAVAFGYDNKALDDVAYADVATRSGQQSGRSGRAISQRLVVKGIDRETATAAVADVDDLRAAIILARKRAFGPFRKEPPDEKRKMKELSAFARGGFGFEIGRRVYDMTRDEAEEILTGEPS